MNIEITYPKTAENPEGLPLPKQALFHSIKRKYKLTAGGFATGKTTLLCIEVLRQLMEYPNNYGVVARKDLQELKSTTLKEFFDICPEYLIKHHNKLDRTVTMINNSQFYYLNLDSNREAERKIKSLNLGFVAIDQIEELDESVFLAFMGRLRRKNSWRGLIATCNPAGRNWVWKRWKECPYDIFVGVIGLGIPEADKICEEIERRIDNTMLDQKNHGLSAGKKRELAIYSGFGMPPEVAKTLYEKYNYALVEATTFDNPYLPPEYVDQLLKYPKNWVKRFVYCSWDDFEGLVYSEYLENRNKIPMYTPSEGELRYIVMDYGYRNPTSIGFYSVDYDGVVRRYREFYKSGMQISDIANYIKDFPEWESAYKLADPSIWNTQRDGSSVGREFSESHGLYFEKADNSVIQGIDKVNEYLRAGKLLFCEDNTNLLSEIGNYKWKAMKAGSDRNEHEEPVKKHDHACLTGDMPILTIRGDVPIKDIKVGDLVYTQKGFKKVIDWAETGIQTIYDYKLNGKIISATPDHKVKFIDGSSKTFFDLTKSDTLCILDKLNYLRCQNTEYQKLLRLTDLSSLYIQIPLAKKCGTIIGGVESAFTDIFGKNIGEKSQKVFISTTKTVIRTIILLKILSAFLRESIYHCTENSLSKRIKNAVSNIWRRLDHSRWLGTLLRRAGKLTQDSVKIMQSLGRGISSFVRYALNPSSQLSLQASTVQITANQPVAGSRDSTELRGLVLAVETRSPVINIWQPNIAQGGALSLPIGRKEKVYNLTVEGEHEYYCNGILLLNCDEIRYLINYVYTPIKPTEEELKLKVVEQANPNSPLSRDIVNVNDRDALWSLY